MSPFVGAFQEDPIPPIAFDIPLREIFDDLFFLPFRVGEVYNLFSFFLLFWG